VTGTHQSIAGSPGGQRRLCKNIVTSLGLTSNFVLCLDSGDTSSYSGSGQTWTDVSGSSNNFLRGGTATVDTFDPTFTGTAGVATESTYWLFDGTDNFGDNGTLSFADNWHNASANWTMLWGFYPPTSANYTPIFTNDTYNGTLNRMAILSNNGNTRKTEIWTSTHGSIPATQAYTADSWNICSCTYAAASNQMTFVINGTAQTIAVSANAAGADVSDQPYFILSSNQGFNPAPNGTRLAFVLAWNTALSTANQQLLRTQLKNLRLPSAV
jgi:hypothetical protein